MPGSSNSFMKMITSNPECHTYFYQPVILSRSRHTFYLAACSFVVVFGWQGYNFMTAIFLLGSQIFADFMQVVVELFGVFFACFSNRFYNRIFHNDCIISYWTTLTRLSISSRLPACRTDHWLNLADKTFIG